MANDSNWGEIYLSTWWGDEFFNINSLSNDAAPKGFGYIGDEYPPVVAYSTHRVIGSSVYPSIRTRRSSDNGEQNIDYSINADLDVVGLDAFVNGEVTDDINTTTDSNADGLADGLFSTGSATTSIVTGNGHIGSAQRADYNTSGGTLQTFQMTTLPPIIGQEITISFLYRSNVTMAIGNAYSNGGDAFKDIPANTGDAIRFEAKAVWSPTGGTDGRIQPMWLRNSGEFVEISDWSVTHHTADGGVVVFRDQVGTIYNKDTFDFSGGTDGFITTDPTNDKVERLESFQGVNNVVRWYAQNANGGTHQARVNNGMNESYRYFVSCKLYLPSTNANITKLALYNGTDYFVVVDGATQSNEWVTITDYIFFGAANPRFFIIGLNDDEDLSFSATAGEEFYFADVVIDGDYSLSNTTADEQPLIVDSGTTETDDFIDFDGSNDRLVTQAIDTFQGDFTIDLEVEFTDVTTSQTIFSNRSASTDRFDIAVQSGVLKFGYNDGTSTTGGRVTISTGTYRITLTREGSTYSLFVNGVSQTLTSSSGLGSNVSGEMIIGMSRNAGTPNYPFFGRVKTLIVYNSALDQAHATRFNEYLQ